MTGQMECLTNVRDVIGCPVGLSDGKRIVAMKEGIVALSDTLKLTNVIYVPCLNCNLICVTTD